MARKSNAKTGRLPSRVLVVEDDAILALALEEALLAHGVPHVDVCHSATEALRQLREQAPDALVIDVHLADRDDGWAIAELAKDVSPRSPRFVFSTAAPQDIPEQISGLGVVLPKPYAPEDLIAALSDTGKTGFLARLRR